MATTKINIEKAINPKWLISNRYTVLLPENKVHRVRLSQILWSNTPGSNNKEKYAIFLQATSGIEIRTLQKYVIQEFAFNITTIGKKMFHDIDLLEKYKKQSFNVSVKENETNLIKYHFRVTDKKGEEINIRAETILDTNKVANLREKIIQAPASLEINSVETKENIAKSICETLATGQYSIHEACDRFNIKYLQFAEWFGTNTYIQQMLAEASVLAQFFNTSIQNSRINRMINELLITGRSTIETIHFSKIYSSANPGGVWAEDKKTIVNRQVDAKDLALLKQIIKNVEMPNFGLDEYDIMEDGEMIKRMDEIRERTLKKLNEKY